MRRPRVLVLAGRPLFRSFFDATRARRLARSCDFRLVPGGRVTPRLRKLLADAEGLVTTWDSPRFGDELRSLAPRLRLLAHCGGEVKGKFARSLFSGYVVTNAPGPMAPYVAELAVTFLLMAARRIDDHRESLRSRSNRAYDDAHLHGSGQETLRGRTVGLVGFGRIGRGIALLLRPFGVRLLVHDPYAPPAAIVRSAGHAASLEAMLPQAEFLVLAAGLTEETRGMIGPRQLAQLPDGATLVNVARGGLVDLAALTREVRRGRLRCALDVTDPLEPLPPGHLLRRLRGAVLTPHVGAGALCVRRAMADIVLDTLERFFRGKRVTNRVTPAMLDLMT
jgi:phosphoglycerate dehydrogenase-like enzyme